MPRLRGGSGNIFLRGKPGVDLLAEAQSVYYLMPCRIVTVVVVAVVVVVAAVVVVVVVAVVVVVPAVLVVVPVVVFWSCSS